MFFRRNNILRERVAAKREKNSLISRQIGLVLYLSIFFEEEQPEGKKE
jgi:hypothetical protein